MVEFSFKDSNLVTGEHDLDFEHAQVFTILNNLADSSLSRSMRIATCERLLHYISEHCKEEENLMKFHQYPDLEDHMEKHRELQDTFLKSLSEFIKQGGTASEDIHKLFYDHILHIDLPMIRFIQSKKKNLPPNPAI